MLACSLLKVVVKDCLPSVYDETFFVPIFQVIITSTDDIVG